MNLVLLRIWDSLAWLLVGFPFFTGGIWVDRPGLKLELSQLAVPVLVVVLLGLFLQNIEPGFLSRSSFIRVCLKLWNLWARVLSARPFTILALSSLGVAVIWALVAVRRHGAFSSHAGDLGIFTSAMWNFTHGNGLISSFKMGTHLLADHQSPLFFVFAPFFKVFPDPQTLLILQSVGLALGGGALWALGRQYFRSPETLRWLPALPLLYWGYLPTRNANAFDFHTETWMLPLFLWGAVGIQSQKNAYRFLGFLSLIAGIAGKESGGPVAAGLGLAWLLGSGPEATRAWTRKFGAVLITLGMGAFVFDLKFLSRWFGEGYAYSQIYAYLGDTPLEQILSPLIKPQVFWPLMVGSARFKFLLGTLAPLGFLPLFGKNMIWAAIPGVLMPFLDPGSHRLSLQYHYGIEASIGWFLALPLGIITAEKISAFRPKFWLPLAVILLALAFHGRPELYRIRKFSPTEHHQWLTQEALPCVGNRTISASGAIAPHLVREKWIHHLPVTAIPPQMGLGTQVQCIVWDTSVNNFPVMPSQNSQFEEDLRRKGYGEEYRCGEFRVLIQKSSNSPCMECYPQCR